jgi:hypothetical protein
MASPTPIDPLPTKVEVMVYTGTDTRFDLRQVADHDLKGERTERRWLLVIRSDLGYVNVLLTPGSRELLRAVICKG